jgi:uncharacterized protein
VGRLRGDQTPTGQARALLADLLDWHRREDKPAWWRYFYVRTLSPAELVGEPDALGGLTGGGVVGQVKRSVVRRFRFPPQEHKFSGLGLLARLLQCCCALGVQLARHIADTRPAGTWRE